MVARRRPSHLTIVPEPKPADPTLAWVEHLIGDISAPRLVSDQHGLMTASFPVEPYEQLLARVKALQNVASAATAYCEESDVVNLMALRDALVVLRVREVCA